MNQEAESNGHPRDRSFSSSMTASADVFAETGRR